MKKRILSLISLIIIVFSTLSLTACSEKDKISGTFEYTNSSYIYTLYLYENGEGFRIVTDNNGTVKYSYRFEYKVLEINKFIAITWHDDNETDIVKYELIDDNHIVLDGATFVRR